jgi:O-antigen biosynthesis protein
MSTLVNFCLNADYVLILLLGAARNLAASKARGKYLLFMDDDNFAKPDELSTFLTVIAKLGDLSILTCFADYFEGLAPPEV